MKYVDFRKFTDEHGAQPIYLFEGEEGYFRERGEMLLKERFLQEPTLDFASFDGSTLKGDGIKAIVDAVNCFPFVTICATPRPQTIRIRVAMIGWMLPTPIRKPLNIPIKMQTKIGIRIAIQKGFTV